MSKKSVNSLLSDALSESVFANALSVMKSNKIFIGKDEDETVYLCIKLDGSQVKLSNKSLKDADVGSVINAVSKGDIDAYVTEETNKNNCFVFIPTAKTIEFLADFLPFTEAEYDFVKVYDDGRIVSMDISVDYKTLVAICGGQKSLSDFLGEAFTAKLKSAETVSSENTSTPPLQPVESEPDNSSDSQNNYVEENQSVPDTADNTASGFDDSQNELPEQDYYQQPYADNVQPEPEPEEDYEVTQDDVYQAITRTFFADDLNIQISTEPFDVQFVKGNPALHFTVNDSYGFVDSAMTQRILQYNQMLENMHLKNIMECRQQFLNLIARRISDIQNEVDTENSATEYGQRKRELEIRRNDRLTAIEETVTKRKKEIEDKFKANRNAAAQAAANKEAANYTRINSAQLDADLYAVDANVRAEIQSDFAQSLHELYVNRRSKAMTLLDVNIEGALNEVAQIYNAEYAREHELYAAYSKDLDDYVSQLHIEATQRAVIEEERLRQSNEANDVRTEMTLKIENIKAEFDAKVSALTAERDTAVRNGEESVRLIKESASENMQLAQKREQELQEQLNKAIVRFQDAESNVKLDFEHRMEQAHDSEMAWKQALETYEMQHKHHNRLAVILMIAAVFAGIAGGFVAGGLYYQKMANNATYSAITENWEPNENGEISPDKKPADNNNASDADKSDNNAE